MIRFAFTIFLLALPLHAAVVAGPPVAFADAARGDNGRVDAIARLLPNGIALIARDVPRRLALVRLAADGSAEPSSYAEISGGDFSADHVIAANVALAGDRLVLAWWTSPDAMAWIAPLGSDGRVGARTPLSQTIGAPALACNATRCVVATLDGTWLFDGDARLLQRLDVRIAVRVTATPSTFLLSMDGGLRRLLDNDGRIIATGRGVKDDDVVFDGSRFVSLSGSGGGRLLLGGIDASTLAAAAPATVMQIAQDEAFSGARLAWNGSEYVVLAGISRVPLPGRGISLLTVRFDRALHLLSPPQLVSLTLTDAFQCDIAPLGDAFAVLWRSGDGDRLRRATLRNGQLSPPAARDGETVLRAAARQEPLVAAASATHILGVWIERDGGTAYLRCARAGDAAPLTLDSAFEPGYAAAAASDGSGFLVMWQMWATSPPYGLRARAAYIDAAGQPLFFDPGPVWPFSLRYAGGRFRAVAGDADGNTHALTIGPGFIERDVILPSAGFPALFDGERLIFTAREPAGVRVQFADVTGGRVVSGLVPVGPFGLPVGLERMADRLFVLIEDANSARPLTIATLTLDGQLLHTQQLADAFSLPLHFARIGDRLFLYRAGLIDLESGETSPLDGIDVVNGLLLSTRHVDGELGGSEQMIAQPLSIPRRRPTALPRQR